MFTLAVAATSAVNFGVESDAQAHSGSNRRQRATGTFLAPTGNEPVGAAA